MNPEKLESKGKSSPSEYNKTLLDVPGEAVEEIGGMVGDMFASAILGIFFVF